MHPKYSSRLAAALAAAALLAGCAGGEKPPISSGDLPQTLPTAADTAPESETLPPTDDTAATTEPETAPMEETSLTTSDPRDFVFEPLSTVMFATDTLNVREYPSTEAKVVGQLNIGDEAEVIGITPDGSWYVLNYNGGRACAFGEYLSAERPEADIEKPVLPEDYYFSSESDYFFIVNKEILLPDDYAIETEYVQGSYELEATAAYWCKKMIAAAEADGIDLKVLSAYRTIKYQQNLIDRNVKSRMEEDGMTYEEAVYDVSINIAPAGGSEHNAGLAVDIIDRNHWDTYEEFEETKEFDWLINHCADYGFILRYPKGKEDITGYIYEPWHYRYVGAKYAKKVADSGLCLEEYIELNGTEG